LKYKIISQLLSNIKFKNLILSFKNPVNKCAPIVPFHFVLRGILVVELFISFLSCWTCPVGRQACFSIFVPESSLPAASRL